MPRRVPVNPFEPDQRKSVSQVLEGMEQISFQGRMLGAAFRIWRDMLTRNVYIFFGLAGAMVPAGMRRILVFLIENRYVDCLVATGANLFHDLHETLGRRHFMIDPNVDDGAMRDRGLDRIYDTYAPEKDFITTDHYVMDFARTLDPARPVTTARFFERLGERANRDKKDDGILTAAFRKGVPIYCPAIADSSYGIALAVLAAKTGHKVALDLVGDVMETEELAAKHRTGVIYVGGGTPKNFVQQTEVTTAILRGDCRGHEYAIQITTDAPHWGGLSGCTFQEAQSWGKIARKAKMASVHCDATIALPILASGLAQTGIRRKLPRPIAKRNPQSVTRKQSHGG
jgi:deoxyhypusine synthase